jgi:DNA invertase Pin-like site-specific DNA recombinase
MKVGYIRVSTEEQNTGRQESTMAELGVEQLFIDKLSGKNTDRKELQAMLKFVRAGDIVVIDEFSRLSRSTSDLIKIVESLNAKGVSFISKKEAIDTTTPAGKFQLSVFAAMAQFERENMLVRQREGIALAKAEGKYKGRPQSTIDEDLLAELYPAYREGTLSAADYMTRLGMKASTFYRRLAQHEKAHNIEAVRRGCGHKPKKEA